MCPESNCNPCGMFVTNIEVLPPSTGSNCPYWIKATTTSADGNPECIDKTVCLLVACDKTLIELKNKLNALFP